MLTMALIFVSTCVVDPAGSMVAQVLAKNYLFDRIFILLNGDFSKRKVNEVVKLLLTDSMASKCPHLHLTANMSEFVVRTLLSI